MRFFLLLFLFFLSVSVRAQQTEQFTHYMMNKYQFNPAYAGFDKSLSITAAYRSQWDPISGNPKQYALNAHLPFYLWNGGIGVSAYSDRLGVEANSRFKLSYNFIYDSTIGFLSTGIAIGLQSKRINGDLIITPGGDYETTIEHNDPLLPINGQQGVSPNWTIATYLVNDYFEAGISISDLFSSDFKIENISYRRNKLANLFFQSFIWLNEDLVLKPSLLLKTNFTQLQSDLGILAEYRDIIGGINFRGYSGQSFESFGIIIGTKLSRHYTISYSFDSTLGALKSISEGTHEILINYNLQKLIGFGLPPKIIYNPRKL